MIGGELRTSAFDELRRGLSAKSRKALKSAFSSESFRLMKEAKQEIRSGVGEAREPLTRKQRPAGKEKALSWLAPLVGYRVRPRGAGFESTIGPSGQTRRRRRPPSREVLESAVTGGRVTITEAKQARIRRRLKARRKRPPKDLRNPRSWGVPQVGSVLEVPERDWVTPLARRELRQALVNIGRKYRDRLLGKARR